MSCQGDKRKAKKTYSCHQQIATTLYARRRRSRRRQLRLSPITKQGQGVRTTALRFGNIAFYSSSSTVHRIIHSSLHGSAKEAEAKGASMKKRTRCTHQRLCGQGKKKNLTHHMAAHFGFNCNYRIYPRSWVYKGNG